MKPADFLWPLPVRLIHWALAVAVVLNLFVVEEGEDLHRWIGYGATALVATRTLYGIFTKSRGAFIYFPLRPAELVAFVRGQFRSAPDLYFRHNPLASWVYLFLWLLVIALGMSGWMMGLDRFWGEEWLEEVHHNFSRALQALIVIHLLGMALDSWKHKRKTWMRMIHKKSSL